MSADKQPPLDLYGFIKAAVTATRERRIAEQEREDGIVRSDVTLTHDDLPPMMVLATDQQFATQVDRVLFDAPANAGEWIHEARLRLTDPMVTYKHDATVTLPKALDALDAAIAVDNITTTAGTSFLQGVEEGWNDAVNHIRGVIDAALKEEN